MIFKAELEGEDLVVEYEGSALDLAAAFLLASKCCPEVTLALKMAVNKVNENENEQTINLN